MTNNVYEKKPQAAQHAAMLRHQDYNSGCPDAAMSNTDSFLYESPTLPFSPISARQ
jgi:hypothetical protein